MTEKLQPPTHLDPEYLYNKYEPLRKSIFYKFRNKMINHMDAEDLVSAIDEIFFALVSEYNPNRGVDFPYYIKKMLEYRTYHFITAYLKTVNAESYEENEVVIEDVSYEELIERILQLNSINPHIVLGDKHRDLMVGLLIERKSLKELADQEGIPADRLHARLYFLLKKMAKECEGDYDKY